MQEDALIARHLAGDGAAFDDLTALYQDRLYRLAFRMLGNHDDAQDAVQEALLRLYRALPAFRGEARFSTWLYRLAANVCIDFRRRQPRGSERVALTADVAPATGPAADPDATLQSHCTGYLVDLALKELPENQRLLLVLRDREGLGNAEVAQILGIDPGTLKSRLHRARQALRRVLERGVTVRVGGGDRHTLRLDREGTLV